MNPYNSEPYAEPSAPKMRSEEQNSEGISLIKRDFENSVKNRKRLLNQIRQASTDDSISPAALKRLLLELRQVSLSILEDILEIEYRYQLKRNKHKQKSSQERLTNMPQITSFESIKDQNLLQSLMEMINDIDDIPRIPNIRAFLPEDFPPSRNPFVLGKTVDELANLEINPPETGNVDQMKMLELLRYKRASAALLRIEKQVQNKMPLTLKDIERLCYRMHDDFNVNILLRAVCVILYNTTNSGVIERGTELHHLTDSALNMTPDEILTLLNKFHENNMNDIPYNIRVDIQATLRKSLRNCFLSRLQDHASSFLVEWVNVILGGSVFIDDLKQETNNNKHTNSAYLKSLDKKGADGRNHRKRVSMADTFDGEQSLTSSIDDGSLSASDVSQGIGRSYEKSEMQAVDEAIARITSQATKDGQHQQQQHHHRHHNSNEEGNGDSLFTSSSAIRKRSSITPPAQFDRNSMSDNDSLSNPNGRQKLRRGGHRRRDDSSKNKQHVPDAHERRDLNAMRYELLKLQQELLRRGILDPRHYHPLSVDKILQKSPWEGMGGGEAGRRSTHGPVTVQDMINAFSSSSQNNGGGGGGTSSLPSLSSQLQLPIVSKSIEWHHYKGAIELDYDPITDVVLGRLYRIHNESTVQKFTQFQDGAKELILTMRFSKLVINRMTGVTTDALVEGKDREYIHEINDICQRVKSALDVLLHSPDVQDDADNPLGNPHRFLVPDLDRLVYKCTMAAGEIAVDVILNRNVECNGMTLTVTPLTNSHSAQSSRYLCPVTLSILDYELQVLLINQRGLYNLAMCKWSSLSLVCQWITSRLRIKRVPLFQSQDEEGNSESKGISAGVSTRLLAIKESSTGSAPTTRSGSRPGTNRNLRKVASGSMSPSRLVSGRKLSNSMDENTLRQNVNKLLNKSSNSGSEFIDYASEGKGESGSLDDNIQESVLLDVSLDRTVEIPDEPQVQWKSRNVPNISGMECKLAAYQENEQLVLDITLSFPRRGQRFLEVEDDEGYVSQIVVANSDDDQKVFHHLSYQLSNLELLIFGVAEKLDEPKVMMVNRGKGSHPSSFMWNILSRMQVVFKGSKANPFAQACDATESDNWYISYERRLLREIRTISNGVMVVTVSAVGSELVYDSAPTDGSIFKTVGSKLVTEAEVKELVLGEGWPLTLLDWGNRVDVASRILDKLKVVEEKMVHRLELYNYPETRILTVSLISGTGFGREDTPLGSIEINEHMTLSDIRVIISHELDRDMIPKAYRFMYKSNPCAARQEGFRKAWECLPNITILPRLQRDGEGKGEALEKRRERINILKAQRRINKSLVPVPIPTLCRVQEDSNAVVTFHEIQELVQPGDVIRIGHVNARDYVVPLPLEGEMDEVTAVRGFLIEPAFDMLNEEVAPFQGNFPLMANEKTKHLTALPPKKKGNHEDDFRQRTATGSPGKPVLETPKTPNTTTDKLSLFPVAISDNEKKTEAVKAPVGNSINGKPVPDMKPQRTLIGNSWTDVWIWKCIPRSEDRRPRWRQLYDDGAVPYRFTYQDRDDGPIHFRIRQKWRDLELLCRDSRCPDLTIYTQRVDEMAVMSVEYFTDLAFNEMCKWYPQFNEFIDGSKFMKLIRDTRVFPDIKKPVRQGQLEHIFQKEVKTYGLADRYATYAGFCRVIQQVALLRYPYGKGNQFADMQASLARTKSGGGMKKKKKPVVSAATSQASADGSSQPTVTPTANKPVEITSTSSEATSTAAAAPATSVSIASTATPIGEAPPVTQNPLPPVTDAKTKPKPWKVPKFGRLSKKTGPTTAVDPAYAQWAYKKLVTDHLMLVPEWANTIWEEAKLSAMNKEAKRQCAATRLRAWWRGITQRRFFLEYRRCLIILQAHVRRRQTQRYIHNLFVKTVEDWAFRRRYYAASLIQACTRRYIVRCRHLRIMKHIREQQLEIANIRRARLRTKRIKQRKLLVYKQMRCVSGVMTVIRIHRKDQRAYSKDFGVIIDVYIPFFSSTFSFTLEEPTLREYMEDCVGTKGLSPADLLERRNMEKLISSRLLCKPSRRAGHPPKVLITAQPLGQKGSKAMVHGRKIGNDEFICTLFERVSDVSVQCYHRLSCKIFECSLIDSIMRKWVQEEYNTVRGLQEHQHELCPLLKSENKKQLHQWLINHIVVDKRHKNYHVLFGCQYKKSRKLEFILMIQSIWRRSIARKKTLAYVSTYLFLVKSTDYEGHYYYLDTKTGVTSWEKPRILSGRDLPESSHQWVKLHYYEHGEMFVNPYNGKYSHMNFDLAGRKIVAAARNYLMKPYALTFAQFKKGYLFEKNIQKDYEGLPTKLANIINYALLSHAIQRNETRAKQLYLDAQKLADSSPLLTRAYALYLLSSCEAPVLSNRDKAISLLKDAKRRDPNVSKFVTATDLFFKYACLRAPQNSLALLNLGLVYYYVYSNLSNAEKLFKRAISLSPFDEKIQQNWSYISDMFPPRNEKYLSPTLTFERKVSVRPSAKGEEPSGEETSDIAAAYIEEKELFSK